MLTVSGKSNDLKTESFYKSIQTDNRFSACKGVKRMSKAIYLSCFLGFFTFLNKNLLLSCKSKKGRTCIRMTHNALFFMKPLINAQKMWLMTSIWPSTIQQGSSSYTIPVLFAWTIYTRCTTCQKTREGAHWKIFFILSIALSGYELAVSPEDSLQSPGVTSWDKLTGMSFS